MSLLTSARAASVFSGYEYYKEKRVISHKLIEDNTYQGQVKGSNDNIYNVIINVDKVRQCSCDCPFAHGTRKICKHMIAMFFEEFPDEAKNYVYERLNSLRYYKKELDEKRQLEENKRIQTEQYVASLSEKQVRTMLVNYMLDLDSSDYYEEEYDSYEIEYDYEYFTNELNRFNKDCKLYLSTVVEGFARIKEFNSIHINIKTNEIIEISDKYDEYNDYIAKTKMITENSDDYIFLPLKFELDEYDIMSKFTDSLSNHKITSYLYGLINRKTPLHMFKSEVFKLNLKDIWYAFINKYTIEQAKDFLFENRTPYINDIELD